MDDTPKDHAWPLRGTTVATGARRCSAALGALAALALFAGCSEGARLVGHVDPQDGVMSLASWSSIGCGTVNVLD